MVEYPPLGESPTQGDPVLPPPRAQSLDGRFVGPVEDPDRYELIAEGIVGGEGTTWRARYHGSLSSPLPVALKRLNPPPTAGRDWPSPTDRGRWSDQAALLRHLNLPQVVQLHQVFVGEAPHLAGAATPGVGSDVYLEMEWVDGPTLSQLLRGRLPTAESVERRLRWVIDVATALTGLHSYTRSGGNPSLHRDVTPGNCIVNPGRGVVLIDLSTMRLLEDSADTAGMHTPEYTAPEVLRAPRQPRDHTCDLYALGALAYFCLTGQDPPRADTAGMLDIVRDQVEELGPGIGLHQVAPLAAHLTDMLDPRPTRRPADMIPWANRLVELARGADVEIVPVAIRPWRRPRVWLLGVAAAVAIAAASVGWAVAGQRTPWTQAGDGTSKITGAETPAITPRSSPSVSSSITPTSVPTTGVTPSAGGTSPSPAVGSSVPRPTKTKTAVVPKTTLPAPAPKSEPASGRITSPDDSSDVQNCQYFSGTSSVPEGMTLMVVVHNLSNPAAGDYADNVKDWQHASAHSTWLGAMYFNDDASGQTFRVQLRAISSARFAEVKDIEGADFNILPNEGTVLDSIEVKRIDGDNGSTCPRD